MSEAKKNIKLEKPREIVSDVMGLGVEATVRYLNVFIIRIVQPS